MKIVSSKRLAALVLGAATTVCPEPSARAQTVPAKAYNNKSYEINVAKTKELVDKNVDVRGGAMLRFTVTRKFT